MIKFFFLINFVFLVHLFSSQTIELEKINGKNYYIHLVEKGNTLYQLKKIYGVNQKDILDANPNLHSGLIIGQRLLIPVNPTTIHHEIKPKETLYSLAKKYKVSLKSIFKNNPGSKSGIEVGQIIVVKNAIIPITKTDTQKLDTNGLIDGVVSTLEFKGEKSIFLKADSIIEYIVQPGETMYTISRRYMCGIKSLKKINNFTSNDLSIGQKILIPIHVTNGNDSKIRDLDTALISIDTSTYSLDSVFLFPEKKKIKIAVFLPLYLDSNKRRSNSQVFSSIDFLMGLTMALDDLKSDSVNLDLHVYDYMSDTANIQQILQMPVFDSMDLIFSPYHAGEALLVSNWCVSNNIPLVTTIPMASKWIYNNPLAYHGVIPYEFLFKKMAEDIIEKHPLKQVVLINSGKKTDELLFDTFREVFYSDSSQNKKLILTTLTEFKDYLTKDSTSVLVLASNSGKIVDDFLSKIDIKSGIVLYGNKSWLRNKNFGTDLYLKPDFYYSDYNDFDYSKPEIIEFHQKYRNKYNRDLTKMTVSGYDIFNFFFNFFFLKEPYKRGLMMDFNMTPNDLRMGYINMSCFITSIKAELLKKQKQEEITPLDNEQN